MKTFKDDIFYDADILTFEEQKALFWKAYSICERWHFDKLNCSESFARQRIKGVSIEEAMNYLSERAIIRVIHRMKMSAFDEEHLLVAFRSGGSPVEYFLWIEVPPAQSAEITDKLSPF